MSVAKGVVRGETSPAKVERLHLLYATVEHHAFVSGDLLLTDLEMKTGKSRAESQVSQKGT